MRVYAPIFESAPIVTPAPMIAYGPISTPLPTTASSLTIAVGCCRTLLPRHRHAQHVRLGDDLAVDGGHSVDSHAVRPALHDLHFHPQLIAGDYGFAEARLVNAAEEEKLVLAI